MILKEKCLTYDDIESVKEWTPEDVLTIEQGVEKGIIYYLNMLFDWADFYRVLIVKEEKLMAERKIKVTQEIVSSLNTQLVEIEALTTFLNCHAYMISSLAISNFSESDIQNYLNTFAECVTGMDSLVSSAKLFKDMCKYEKP